MKDDRKIEGEVDKKEDVEIHNPEVLSSGVKTKKREGLVSTIMGWGSYFLGCLGFLAILALPAIFIVGGITVGEILLPWLYRVFWIAFSIDLLILLPAGISKKIRPYAGVGLFISSFIFGITLWLTGLLVTYVLWGMWAVIIGLFIFGVGVVPLAMLATLFGGLWSMLGFLLFGVFVTFGTRVLGMTWAE